MSLEKPKWILRGFEINPFIGMRSKSSRDTRKHLSENPKINSTPLEKIAQFKEFIYLWGIFNSTAPRERKTMRPGRHYYYLEGITHSVWSPGDQVAEQAINKNFKFYFKIYYF